jgi:hypothetical protein
VERGLGTDINDVIVKVISTGTVVVIGAAVNRFRKRATSPRSRSRARIKGPCGTSRQSDYLRPPGRTRGVVVAIAVPPANTPDV